MLDQNTDRMWFVIGAVIVGAAIIFIANGSLPTLFASVSDTFGESSDEALRVIDEDLFSAYYVKDSMLSPNSGVSSYRFSGDGSFEMDLNSHRYSGMVIRPGLEPGYGIKGGKRYEVTYKLQKLNGTLNNVQHEFSDANHLYMDSNMYIEGKKTNLQTWYNLNDTSDVVDVKLSILHVDEVPPTLSFTLRVNFESDDPVSVRVTDLMIREVLR